MPEKIYDGNSAVVLQITRNNYCNCDGTFAVTITLFENFFSKNHPNLPLPSANIMRGLFEFFVNISELGRTNVFSRWE